MFCLQCGATLQPGVHFCTGCGRPVGEASFSPQPQNRVAVHLRLLAIFWFVASGIRLLPGMVLLTMFGPDSHLLPPDVPGFVNGILQSVGWLLIGSAAIGLAAGWGLIEKQPWGRMLAIVLGFLSLIDLPFGTAIGIYTLWVLLPATSEREYRLISQAA